MPVMRLAVAGIGRHCLVTFLEILYKKKLSGRDDYDFRNAENVIDRIAAVELELWGLWEIS